MANIKSAIKRVEIAERNRLRNKSYKSSVKTFMKKCFAAVGSHAANPTPESEQIVQASLASAYSHIDKAVKRGALHANTAARRKSRLMRTVKGLEVDKTTVS
ncbi:MAG: 30S ribosomal protein S20 [Leptolyngbya sp.]|nr:MAG: 30S ribosomal protein S20 [Leptolyngbya sp.]